MGLLLLVRKKKNRMKLTLVSRETSNLCGPVPNWSTTPTDRDSPGIQTGVRLEVAGITTPMVPILHGASGWYVGRLKEGTGMTRRAFWVPLKSCPRGLGGYVVSVEEKMSKRSAALAGCYRCL